MKRPRIKSPAYGWCLVDLQGDLCFGAIYRSKEYARLVGESCESKRVVPVRITALARMPKRRGRR